MMLKFERYLYSTKELNNVVKRLKNPACRTITFYDYLELKDIFFNLHSGTMKDVIEFELLAIREDYTAMKSIKKFNKNKTEKDKKSIKIMSKVYKARVNIHYGNKKITIN